VNDGVRAVVPPSTGTTFGTPEWLYRHLDARWRFTLDPCPYKDALIWDGLAMSWAGERVYCNPPYGRKAIPDWLAKRFEPEVAVYLLPARTDAAWWHECVMGQAVEVTFIRNRICFVGMRTPAYFPSVIVTYEREWPQATLYTSLHLTELEPTRGYRLARAVSAPEEETK
jgi:hypothetical protein